MNKVIFLAVLSAIQLVRYYVSRFEASRHLIVSFFILSIPLQISFPVYKQILLSGAGTIGTAVNITLPLVLSLLLIPAYKLPAGEFTFLKNKWPVIIFFLFLISFINPFNEAKFATFVVLLFIFSHFLFFMLVYCNIPKPEIIRGVFDAFVILCTVQVVLAICFPLLGISAVTKLFFAGAEGWATRQGARPGAVGTFTHPGNLALYTTIASAFFMSCFLCGYRKKTAVFLIIINLITVILTYSRTSYLTILFDLLFVYFIFANARKQIFSIANVIKFLLPISAVLIWVVFFSPFSDIFLNSDADDMFSARLMHWKMALDLFNTSPVIGVGLNAHLEYFARHSLNIKSIDLNNLFLISNPIHSIHLIVLSETGIIGFIIWVYFVFSNIFHAKEQVARDNGNRIFPLTMIGVLVAYVIYGSTGWAPLSAGILPFFLFFTFFAIKYSRD